MNLLLSTGNMHKVEEMHYYLKDTKLNLLSLKDVGITESPEETGNTFAENAVLKAKYYSDLSGVPALADDSGICIEAINNLPGIYSARWLGGNGDLAKAKILERLPRSEESIWAASMVCVLALIDAAGDIQTYKGEVKGVVDLSYSIEGSFGYDSIFIPQGYKKTFTQLGKYEKYKCSHRHDAFMQMLNTLNI